MNDRDYFRAMMLAQSGYRPQPQRRGCGCGPLLFVVLFLPLDIFFLGRWVGWW